MSHELRSPLNAILGFAQLMESSSPPPTATQTESIAQILQAGWYLLKLIDEILDLATIESGTASPAKEAVSLSEILVECQTMMEPRARQFDVLMTFPDSTTPFTFGGIGTRVKQIVINLLSNAIKYNKPQGTVVVDCSFGNRGRVRFCVRDAGEGLSSEKLSQLFQPFNRLGQETSGVVGTGIGLVVTKRLVELMDGTLEVSSTVGVGSTFCCDLPVAQPPQLSARDDKDPGPPKPGSMCVTTLRTLLYVEDNPANLMLVERLIARRPEMQLLSAVNGTLGVELARVHQPEVILMDINLPGISGITALKKLREDAATAHIPVIALSANAMPHDIAKGVEVGFFGYLTKPIKIDDFTDMLNAALDSAEKRQIGKQLP